MKNYPKIGIRPTIDGRQGGVRESLEEKTMNLAKAVADLITKNLRYPDGTPVQCVIADGTISTFVRLLEGKGYLTHIKTGNTYLYAPAVTRDEYSRSTLRSVVDRYFGSSIAGVVSALFRDEKLSDAEIRDLIEQVTAGNNSKED